MVRNIRIFSGLLAILLLVSFILQAGVVQASSLPDFRELAQKTGSAVVNISTEKTVQGVPNPFGGMFRNMPQGTPFDKFFEQFDSFGGQLRPQKQRSLGSGFIISEDGYIVTNNHVIADADVIHVNLGDNTKDKNNSYTATLIGSDAETDLALLKIEAKKPLPVLPFGDSDELEVGEWLMAIGNPFGLDHSVTTGILSAKGRDIRSGPFDNFLQTDASINPGNSGGPLINMKGEVIGINTAIIASGQGIGFAIPSNMAERIIDQLKTHKKVHRGWLGVTIQDIDENTARALGLDSPRGALVGSVIPNEPAANAGIIAGDILLNVNGKKMSDAGELLREIASFKPNDTITVTLWRNGSTKDVRLTLGERKTNQQVASFNQQQGTPQDLAATMLGLAVRPLNAEEARALNLNKPQGLVIIGIKQGSPASEADLRTGDIITTANLKSVNSNAELDNVLKNDAQKRGAVMLQIQRSGQSFFRTLALNNSK